MPSIRGEKLAGNPSKSEQEVYILAGRKIFSRTIRHLPSIILPWLIWSGQNTKVPPGVKYNYCRCLHLAGTPFATPFRFSLLRTPLAIGASMKCKKLSRYHLKRIHICTLFFMIKNDMT